MMMTLTFVSLLLHGAAPPPKLVVVVVVDQLSADTLTAMEPRLSKTGFKRVFREGLTFTQANYEQLATYTGPGHATIATGAYPHKNGITSNKYFDRAQNKSFTALFDAEAPVLDAPPDVEDDSSPRALQVLTLGDVLLQTSPKSKVVAIALKDRAAVLMGGHHGKAYWFSEATGQMTSSTYYAPTVPPWVKAFNASHHLDTTLDQLWQRAAETSSYTGIDEAPYEADYKGLGRTFPHVVKAGRDFVLAWEATPFATQYELDFALAALDAEKLGADDAPDVLAVSFTPTDYAGHAYGPDSHEVQDSVLAVDRALGSLISMVEKKVGAKNVVFAVTADHGSAPAPERVTSPDKPTRRIKKAELKAALNQQLSARFGEGDWVLALEDPSIYLNLKLAEERQVPNEVLEHAAVAAALTVKNIAAGFTRTELLAKQSTAPLFHATELSFFPNKAGDVLLVPEAGSFWGKYGEKNEGSTHGSPYSYDTHVPLAFYGAGVPKQTTAAAASPADLAPTLAKLLRLTLPDADGHPRPEMR